MNTLPRYEVVRERFKSFVSNKVKACASLLPDAVANATHDVRSEVQLWQSSEVNGGVFDCLPVGGVPSRELQDACPICFPSKLSERLPG